RKNAAKIQHALVAPVAGAAKDLPLHLLPRETVHGDGESLLPGKIFQVPNLYQRILNVGCEYLQIVLVKGNQLQEIHRRRSLSTGTPLNRYGFHGPTRRSSGDALDFGSAVREFFLKPLETAVEVIDAVDGGLTFRGKARDDERDGCAKVGGHDGSALQPLHALHDRGLAVEGDVGTKAGELLHVHEAVLENRLGDARLALRPGHQRHELGLQVGREAGEG